MTELVERPSGRIAIYVRVSSRGQEDNESIPTQIAECRQLTHDLGYVDEQVDIFEDVHTGEELWERDEMSRLRKLIEHRVYDGLVVFCVDRLSRKVPHQMIIEEECRHADCTIHYVQGGPSNTREGRLMRQVEGIVAEFEHEKIVERTNRGRREKLRMGKVVGNGEPPFGYLYLRDDRGKPIGLMADPMQSHYVAAIYEKLAAGQSLCAISDWLNSERVPVPGTGRKRRLTKDIWYSASVRFIVKNSTYMGDVYVGKQRIESVVNPENKKREKKLVRQPEESWVRLENAMVTPLVNRELWQKANDRLLINKIRAARNNHHQDRFLLRAGFARCGECGGIMYAKHDKTMGDFYACSSQWRENKRDRCTAPASIQAPQLDADVWRIVWLYLREPDRLFAQLDILQSDAAIGSLQPEIDKLDTQIGSLSSKVANAFEELVSIDDEDIKATIRVKMATWQKHLQQFRSDRDTLVNRQQFWMDRQEKVQQFKAKMVDVSTTAEHLDIATKRDALEALGVQVIVSKAQRKGPQEMGAAPRWRMTWDIPVDPSVIANESRTQRIHNGFIVYWSWDGETIFPEVSIAVPA